MLKFGLAYKYLCMFIGMLTDVGSLAWDQLVDYKNFLWRLTKRLVLFAAIPIPVLLVCLIFGWHVNWLYSAYFMFVGIEAVILIVLAFPIIVAAQLITDKFPKFAATIQRSVQKIAAVAFWALMIAVCFYVLPIRENPKMIPLVLMSAAALALGAYAGCVRLPAGSVRATATVFLLGTFVLAVLAVSFPNRTLQLVGSMHTIDDIDPARPKRLSISYEDVTNERVAFFRSDGSSSVWYYEKEDGTFELFDKGGFHPVYKAALRPVTREIAIKLMDQLRIEKDERTFQQDALYRKAFTESQKAAQLADNEKAIANQLRDEKTFQEGELYRKADKENNINAQYNVALHYLRNAEVMHARGDRLFGFSKLMNFTNEAALLKNIITNNAFDSYCRTDGIAQEYTKAAKWFRKAADQGDAEAQSQMGYMYLVGDGVPKDAAESIRWYRLAAEQNHAFAQFKLGLANYHGRDYGGELPKDYTEAVRWFSKAAEQGLAEAQESLGDCYANGEGVQKDLVEGYKWRLLAARRGHPFAGSTIARQGSSMTPEQIVEGKNRATEWEKQHSGANR